MIDTKPIEIEIKNLCIRIEDIDIDISHFCNKTILQDLKLLMFYKLKGNKLISRDKIELINCNLNEYNDKNELPKKILLKTNIKKLKKDEEKNEFIVDGERKLILGYFKVIDEKTIKPTSDNELFKIIENPNIDDYTAKIWDDCIGKDNLKMIYEKYSDKKEDIIKEKYKNNGLLKMYYYMTLEFARINNEPRIAGKASAMCSYLAVKKIFNEYFNKYFNNNNLEYEISNPNVFIKDKNIEYDALVIKKNDNNKDKYFFSEEDVIATIEIKTSGYFTSKDDLLTNEGTNGFIDYLKKEKLSNEHKHIYISIYESFGEKNTSIHYYEYLLANLSTLKDDGYYGIFCGTKKDQDYFLIPYEYDLEKILDNIFEK